MGPIGFDTVADDVDDERPGETELERLDARYVAYLKEIGEEPEEIEAKRKRTPGVRNE